jgi:hypothetical protein
MVNFDLKAHVKNACRPFKIRPCHATPSEKELNVKLSCDSRFQRAFTACGCVKRSSQRSLNVKNSHTKMLTPDWPDATMLWK